MTKKMQFLYRELSAYEHRALCIYFPGHTCTHQDRLNHRKSIQPGNNIRYHYQGQLSGCALPDSRLSESGHILDTNLDQELWFRTHDFVQKSPMVEALQLFSLTAVTGTTLYHYCDYHTRLFPKPMLSKCISQNLQSNLNMPHCGHSIVM